MKITEKYPVDLPKGYFTTEDFESCQKAAKTLSQGGQITLLTASRKALVGYYLEKVTSILSDKSETDLKIRKLPNERDSILSFLNGRLNGVSWDCLSEHALSNTREIWIADFLNKASLSDLIFAAQTVKKLPGAGISLLVVVDRESSRGLKDLMHSIKMERFDFNEPSEEQVKKVLADNISRTCNLGLISIAEEMGYWNQTELDERKAETLCNGGARSERVSAHLNRFMSDQDVETLLKAEKKKRRSQKSSSPEVVRTNAAWISSNLKKGGQLFFGVLIVSTLLAYQVKAFQDKNGSGLSAGGNNAPPELPESKKANPKLTERDRTLRSETLENRNSIPKNSLRSSQSDREFPEEADLKFLFPDYGSAEATTLRSKPEKRATPLSLDHDETLSEDKLLTSGITKSRDQNEQKFFIQHAAFDNLDGAIIWKKSKAKEIATEIFTKGEKPKRFVLLSGPFNERKKASSFIDQNSDAFVIEGKSVMQPILTLTGF